MMSNEAALLHVFNEMEGEANAGGIGNSRPMLFKKKSKSRASALGSVTSKSSVLESQTKANNENGAEADEDDDVGVKRTALIRSRGKEIASSRKPRASTSALSFGEDTTSEPAFQLKKSALAQAARQRHAAASSLPDSLEQASIGEISNGYSASALAALKASTPARRAIEGDGELDLAHQEMIDPSTQYDEDGNSLARLRFGADLADLGIPSEAVVAAAKDRRKKAALSGTNTEVTSDFISLCDNDNAGRGPHPESRLQREEDEQGSGEEEFAEYTGATERVALGQKAIKQEKVRERNERQEAMELDDSDDSGQEWERAQLGRIDMSMPRKQREKREKSPFKPAPIPMTAPLPSLTSTSARLATKISMIEASVTNHQRVVDDAVRQLKEMEGDEARNKDNILIASEKEAWFRELDDFIISLSTFLDEKMPQLEEIELDWKGILVERTRVIQKARASKMIDEVCLFYGVPYVSLLPTPSESDECRVDVPMNDGDALSTIREARRTISVSADALNPADQAAFEAAQRDIIRRSRQILDDVKAPEFIDPAIRIESKLHPSCLVSRFHQWRKIYSAEYANAWGGLTLAGIWDFWVRREISGWDYVKEGRHSLDSFAWHKELVRYSAATSNKTDNGESNGAALETPIGGDDEVILHIYTNSIIPRVQEIIEAGGVDVWNSADIQSIVSLMEQISYVLERDNSRFQSLTSVLLLQFEKHIMAIIAALSAPAIRPLPPFDPRAPSSLVAFFEQVKMLLYNLISLNRNVPSNERPFFLDLVDRLVGKNIWNLLIMAKETGASRAIANDILIKCSRGNLLKEDLRSRLSAMANN